MLSRNIFRAAIASAFIVSASASAQPFDAASTSLVSIGTYTGATLPTAAANANPRQSKNGRFVVFQSAATNLVDTSSGRYNGFLFNTDSNANQIYLLDRQSGTLELISQIGTNNQPAPMDCTDPVVSADGRYVAYVAETTGREAEFMRARAVRPSSDGGPGFTYNSLKVNPEINETDIDGSPGSAYTALVGNVCLYDEGCHVNYWVDGTHVWIRDRLANENFVSTQVSLPVKRQALDEFGVPATVDFVACNGDNEGSVSDGLGCNDVSATCTVSNPPNPATDAGFNAKKPVLEDAVIRVAQGILVTRRPLVIDDAIAANPFLGGDGRFIVYDSDSNYLAGIVNPQNFPPAVCRDALTQSPVNVNADYDPEDGIIDNGFFSVPGCCYVDDQPERDLRGFEANLRDVFVRDGVAAQPATASVPENKIASFGCQYHGACNVQGNADSIRGSISDDGKFVSFESKATTFLDLDFNGVTNPSSSTGLFYDPNDPDAYDPVGSDVFVVERELLNGEVSNLSRVSNAANRITAANTTSGTAASTRSVLSADGRYVVFQSSGSNIVSSDTNGVEDIFVYDRSFFTPVRCVSSTGAQGDAASTNGDITGNGETVGFISSSTNFGASTGFANAFIGRLSKDSDGRLTGCAIELASIGGGSGANANVTKVSVGIQPRSETLGDNTVRRTRVTSASYLTSATNVQSAITDSNGEADVFFSPTCSAEDLASDRDGDGTNDCFDQCWEDPLKVVDTDADTDGVADCEDGCPADPQKQTAGICGCGVADNDSDSDGTPDCTDQCPTSAIKVAPGVCGCSIADTDANSNGVIDCNESDIPSATPQPTATPVVFTSVVPQAPELSLAGSRQVQIVLPLTGIPTTLPLNQYEIRLTRRTNNASRTTTIRINPEDGNSVVRRVKAGRYTARFRVRNSGSQFTRLSLTSRSVRVR